MMVSGGAGPKTHLLQRSAPRRREERERMRARLSCRLAQVRASVGGVVARRPDAAAVLCLGRYRPGEDSTDGSAGKSSSLLRGSKRRVGRCIAAAQATPLMGEWGPLEGDYRLPTAPAGSTVVFSCGCWKRKEQRRRAAARAARAAARLPSSQQDLKRRQAGAFRADRRSLYEKLLDTLDGSRASAAQRRLTIDRSSRGCEKGVTTRQARFRGRLEASCTADRDPLSSAISQDFS